MAQEKIVWITGGGTGIGRDLALLMADQGWRVAVSGRRREPLEEVAAAAGGNRVSAWACDVTDADAVAATVSGIREQLGEPDLVVLNAGTYSAFKVAEFDLELFRRTIDINIMGVANCLHATVPAMAARRSGHVAIVASVAGYVGLPLSGPYGASKAALINLCESMKPELDKYGVAISVINPGFVKTPLTDQNEFPMPFLMESEQAAQIIYRGLMDRDFEIAFPRRMVWSLKSLRRLPYSAFFKAVQSMVKS